MENFASRYDFPMNAVMVGSMIPGIRVVVPPTKIATYGDGTDHPLVKRTAPTVDPLMPQGEQVKYPGMGEPHAQGHGFLEKLKAMMLGRPAGPQMREGYEAVRENRDWRVS